MKEDDDDDVDNTIPVTSHCNDIVFAWMMTSLQPAGNEMTSSRVIALK